MTKSLFLKTSIIEAVPKFCIFFKDVLFVKCKIFEKKVILEFSLGHFANFRFRFIDKNVLAKEEEEMKVFV